jgi:hypothetical protein|tara:strand:+ start:76 stop:444 length:369 start_codon:yes stop_codon:yes gene_type:complete
MFINRNNDNIYAMLSKIDKSVALTTQSLESLKVTFEEHTDEQKQWEADILKQLLVCPETVYIKAQNGKLDTLNTLVTQYTSKVDLQFETAKTKKDIWSSVGKVLSVLAAIGGVVTAIITLCL